MAITPLSEESEYHVVHPNQDCRGWPLVDETGAVLGRVQELLIDTERDRVNALRLEDGSLVAVERVTLLDGTVVLEDALLPVVAAPRRSARWSELPVQRRGTFRTFASFDDELRRHHLAVAADSGHSYEAMLPAYRYGYELAGGERHRGRAWDTALPDVRREWEATYPATPWDQVHVAVQGAWDRVRGAS